MRILNIPIGILGLILLVGSSFTDCSQASSTNQHKDSSKQNDHSVYREGDIVFQKSVSAQCKAIRAATHSEWTHVGILFYDNGQWQVLEAIEPVCLTPVDVWMKRSSCNEVMRLKEADALKADNLQAMKKMSKGWLNLHYDSGFAWDDNEMYCSELVYKLYDRVLDRQVGELKQLKDYDLEAPVVKKIMEARYGDAIPFEEWMIAPGAMHDSPLLKSVIVDCR
jgi:Permuted papain-like amidase enzyme, YaeF/YiiX, C92 family